MTHSTADLDMRDHYGLPPRDLPPLQCSHPDGCIDPETCRVFGNGRGCAVPQTGAELLHTIPDDFLRPMISPADAIKALALIDSVAIALGTDERGEALVEVARNTYRAKMELATLQRKIESLGEQFNRLAGFGDVASTVGASGQ